MIKLRIVCIITVVVIFGLSVSGCYFMPQSQRVTDSQSSSINDNSLSSSSGSDIVSQSSSSSAASSQVSSSAATPSKSSSSQATESFMGDWAITKIVAYCSGGNTYFPETIIGKQLTFSSEKATCFGDNIDVMNNTLSSPSYKKETLSNDELWEGYRATFKMLGVTTDSLTQVSAYDNQGNGVTFFVIDNDTLLLEGGGVFFQLKRSN